ncbi:DUF412 domain-containing protein [Aestuariibacter halophilus]|uniref:UPF0208 membrane protein YfbV n=1 Tax=Fluctibacter halophilus TaxID=226011 RepID=A0ABS8G4P3_9ALTE|nr:terminus macrodomain insulation protein YfbV [Aestuariibacter halophilus]MCC2615408.1 DUF412 domain-containing protein [Aestuariibacter halophilus]
MSMSVTTLLKSGQQYMRTWPMQKELYSLFPECKVIKATRFANMVMPPAAVVCSMLLYQANGADAIPQILTVMAVFLSIPLQGVLWLGHRANQALPPSMRRWYFEVQQKMRSEGCFVGHSGSDSKLRYMELARLLKTAFDELDRVFTRQWF